MFTAISKRNEVPNCQVCNEPMELESDLGVSKNKKVVHITRRNTHGLDDTNVKYAKRIRRPTHHKRSNN